MRSGFKMAALIRRWPPKGQAVTSRWKTRFIRSAQAEPLGRAPSRRCGHRGPLRPGDRGQHRQRGPDQIRRHRGHREHDLPREGLNKELGTSLLITGATLHALGEPPLALRVEERGQHPVRGRSEPVRVYTCSEAGRTGAPRARELIGRHGCRTAALPAIC